MNPSVCNGLLGAIGNKDVHIPPLARARHIFAEQKALGSHDDNSSFCIVSHFHVVCNVQF